MPTLEIPERYVAGVCKILRLDDKAVEEIRSSLEREGQSDAAPNDVRSKMSRAVSDLEIMEALLSLYAVKSSRELPTEEFAVAVCAAAERQASDCRKLTPDEQTRSKGILIKLLNIDSIGTLTKAFDLQTSDERIFCEARIFTDLRPVFGPDIPQGPKGLVIIHHLKLSYHQPGTNRRWNFYVSLDAEDLAALHKVIERAEQKAGALRSSVSKTPYMGY